jgi:hypothetical protein
VNSSQCVGGSATAVGMLAVSKLYAVKITFQCSLVQMNVVHILLVVVKCVKGGIGLLL